MSTPVPPTPRPSAGAWLTSLMERRGVTVQHIAEALNVTEKTVYYWRNDKTTVSEERVPGLAEILGVSEIEARRGLGLWVPAGTTEEPPALDRDQLREALDRFRKAADDLERLINQPPPQR